MQVEPTQNQTLAQKFEQLSPGQKRLLMRDFFFTYGYKSRQTFYYKISGICLRKNEELFFKNKLNII